MKTEHELFLTTTETFAQAISLRDTYTGEHSRRVTLFALHLGQQFHLAAAELEAIRCVTPLHDIGKIGIPDGVLRKPGPLTSEEFEVMKTHTTLGVKFLEPVPFLRPWLPIVRSHHERWDGDGYPDGLAGEVIPLLARVVAVADGFDAMTFDTPYRRGFPVEQAFAELEKHSGQQYDPTLVRVFLRSHKRVVEQVEAITHPRRTRENGFV